MSCKIFGGTFGCIWPPDWPNNSGSLSLQKFRMTSILDTSVDETSTYILTNKYQI